MFHVVECCKYFSSLTTDDARCAREIKPTITVAEAAFIKNRILYTNKLDITLMKKLIEC
jgi:hypothetical protein